MPKSRLVQISILSLKFQRNFIDSILFCVSFTTNLASSNYWNLYWTIRLGATWSYYWSEITGQITKFLSVFLISYPWEMKFCNRDSMIRDLILNLQQKTRHSATPSICAWSIFLYLATAFSGFLGFLIGSYLPSYQKVSIPENSSVYIAEEVNIWSGAE